MQVEKKNIGGISCLFIPMESSTSTTIHILAKAGSNYENKATNGISHFLEHMFFKGSKHYPSAKIQTNAIEQFGGEVNAFTSNAYAGYYIKSAPEFTNKALDILADMIVHPLFPADEMGKEKGVVVQEIMMYQDNPARLVKHLHDFAFLGDNNYGREILGTADTVNSFTQEQLFTHKEQLYTKDNIVVVISGKILDQQQLEDQIPGLFTDLHPTFSGYKAPFEWSYPGVSEAFFNKQTEQNHLIISSMGYSGEQEERFAAKTLGYILGGNMSSRLFQEIREKEGLCYYIYADHASTPEYGMFNIRAGIQKDKFNFGKEKIYEELAKISKGDITKEELDAIQGYIRGTLQISMETSDEVGYVLGLQQLLYNNAETLEEKLKKYSSVSLDQVNAVAEKLKKEHLFTYWIQ